MGSWEWDLSTDRVSCSAGLYNIFGLKAEATGRSIEPELRDHVHPGDRDSVRSAIEQAVSGLASTSIEYRAIRADGRVRILDLRADPIVDETGKAARLIAVVHDVTDARRAQQTLSAASSDLAKYVQELRALEAAIGADGEPKAPQAPLSTRQMEILRLVAQGLTNAQIAKQIFVSKSTVKWHLKAILSKTNSTNRTEAVARVIGTRRQDGVGM